MGDGLKSSTIPLLQSPSTGTASKIQTLGNIIVSVVGTGILGLPFAFRIAGWLAGSLGVLAAGMATYYCMLLLVSQFNFLLFFSYSSSIEFLLPRCSFYTSSMYLIEG